MYIFYCKSLQKLQRCKIESAVLYYSTILFTSGRREKMGSSQQFYLFLNGLFFCRHKPIGEKNRMASQISAGVESVEAN
jgi:hypothetical protein